MAVGRRPFEAESTREILEMHRHQPPPDPGEACIAEWPVRRQVGQLLAVAVDGGALEAEAARVAELGAGAVLLQRPALHGRRRHWTGLRKNFQK